MLGISVVSVFLFFMLDVYLIGKAIEVRPVKGDVSGKSVEAIVRYVVVLPWEVVGLCWIVLPLESEKVTWVSPAVALILVLFLVAGLIWLSIKLTCEAPKFFWDLEGIIKGTALGSAVGLLLLAGLIGGGLSLLDVLIVLTPIGIYLWASLRIVRTLKLSFKASGINGPEDLKNYIVKDPICRWWLRPKG